MRGAAALILPLLVEFASCQHRRFVHISGRIFVDAATSEQIVLGGPNVIVKGPPYLPLVEGDTHCHDRPTDPHHECLEHPHLCSSCQTFNQADVNHIKEMGWNSIRLGVVWAGAQPRDEDALDPDFLVRLHTILNLTDANRLHVVLDNHGDMVGSQNCGNGVPTWFQRKAAAHLFGKPLYTEPGVPALVAKWIPASELNVTKIRGYDHCGDDEAKWAKFAGDPYYNLLNECCQAINAGNVPGGNNPIALGYTALSQRTMDRLVAPGPGRKEFVRFWRLMAEAVKDHPSAVAAEVI